MILLLCLGYTAGARLAQIEAPLERDEGEYALMGQLLLDGVPPYKEAANMKFPGVYLTNAAAFLALGQSVRTIHLLTLGVVSVTLLVSSLLAKRIGGAVSGSLTALALAVLLNHPKFLAFAGHASHFVVLWSVLGLCLYRLLPANRAYLGMFFVGVCLGLSLLMKQHGFVFLLVPLVGDKYRWLFEKKLSALGWITRALCLGVGTILPFALTCIWLYRAGVLSDFWFWTVTYAREYASIVPLKDAPGHFVDEFRYASEYLTPLLFLAGVGLTWLAFDRKLGFDRVFLLSFLFAGLLSIVPGFYFRSHYFLQAAVPTALVLGIGLAGFSKWLEVKQPWEAFALTWGGIIFAVAWAIVPYTNLIFRSSNAKFINTLYGHQAFVDSDVLARFIVEQSSPDEKIAIFGSEPQILFLAHRKPALPFLYVYPLVENQPFAVEMQKRGVHAVETIKPPVVLAIQHSTSWLAHDDSPNFIFQWMNENLKRDYDMVGWAPLRQDQERAYFTWGNNQKGRPVEGSESFLIFLRKDLHQKRRPIKPPTMH